MRRTALLTATLCLALPTTAARASESSPAVSLAARLVPGELTRQPVGIRPGARGRFSGSFNPYGSSVGAHFSLTTRHLTGRVITAHIHSGAPGRNGPILITLCSHSRCNLSGSSFHSYHREMLESIRLLGAYVDVHTKKNPRGELRGQIVFG